MAWLGKKHHTSKGKLSITFLLVVCYLLPDSGRAHLILRLGYMSMTFYFRMLYSYSVEGDGCTWIYYMCWNFRFKGVVIENVDRI